MSYTEFLECLNLNEGFIGAVENGKLKDNPFIKPNGPVIYAFTTDKVKDAIKIGYTDQNPMRRIAQWQKIYGDKEGEVVCIGWWSCDEVNEAGERVFFWDHAVHKKVVERGFKNIEKEYFQDYLTQKGKEIVDLHYSKEFFAKYRTLMTGNIVGDTEELSAKLIESIIEEMRGAMRMSVAKTPDFTIYKFENGRTSTTKADTHFKSPDTYPNTSLQEECIVNGVNAINAGKKNMLMAAVMRFGKTHAAYEIVKRSNLKTAIVVSAKADVRDSWRNDINHTSFYKDFVFVEILPDNIWVTELGNNGTLVRHAITLNFNEDCTSLLKTYRDKTIVFFFSTHDLIGNMNSMKERHKGLFDIDFDIAIVDETHYGSHGNKTGKLTGLTDTQLDEEDLYEIQAEQENFNEDQSNLNSVKARLKYKTMLQVSGTPYYILMSNEMLDEDAEIISKVSYTDMIEAKNKWEETNPDKPVSSSPYFGIPVLHKIGLNLSRECKSVLKEKNLDLSISSLFNRNKAGKLKYFNEVTGLMKHIFGDGTSDELSILKNKSVEGNKLCKHTIMVLPAIIACDRVYEVLKNVLNENEREIILLSSKYYKSQVIQNIDELNDKLEELDNKGKKSVILTVRRFLTGVSMPLVDSMIYLKNSSSPQEYDQSIFRLCTRNVRNVKNINGEDEDSPKKVNMKNNVYLIDFNIDNMYNMVINSARARAQANGESGMKIVKEYLKRDLSAIPIFVEDENQNNISLSMHEVTNNDLMKVFTKYNDSKTIDDIVNDDISKLDKMFENTDLQSKLILSKVEKTTIKNSINGLNQEGEDNIDIVNDNESETTEKTEHTTTKTGVKTNKLSKETKAKFIGMFKSILLCNLAMDDPFYDMDDILKNSRGTKFEYLLSKLSTNLDEVESVWKVIGNISKHYQRILNEQIYQISLKVKEGSRKQYERAIEDFSKIQKNEVVTPGKLVNKMIAKLNDEDYEKANSILLFNEKQGEYFKGLVEKFGKDIANKCKIVCSSAIGKEFTMKTIKYYTKADPKDIIIDMKDDDIKNFLEYDAPYNFDICLMNPPYDKNMHLKFLEKVIKNCDKVVSVQPTRWLEDPFALFKRSTLSKYKDVANKINSIDIFKNSDIFDIHIYSNLGIYLIDNKNENTIDYKNYWKNNRPSEEISIIEKCCFNDNIKRLSDVIEKDKRNGIRVLIGLISGNRGNLPIYKDIAYAIDGFLNGKDWTQCKNMGGYEKKTNSLIPNSIKFDTIEEAKNFYDSYKTKFMRTLCDITVQQQNIQVEYLPFMDDYSKPWTDKRFYEFFNLTNKEIHYIENYI